MAPASLDLDVNVVEPRLHLVRGGRLKLIDRLEILGTASRGLEHPLVVDRQDDIVPGVDLRDVAGAHPEEVADVEDVLAISREIEVDVEPAARPERKSVHVGALVDVDRHAILVRAGLRIRAADRLPADVPGCLDVLLEIGRRGPQHCRDVVETVAGNVLRQHVGDVDIEAQHRLDRIGVLGAVHPVHAHGSRRGTRLGSRVELSFHPMHELIDGLIRRLRIARRRHQVPAQLAYRLLPDFSVGTDVVGGHRVVRDAPCPIGSVVTLLAALLEELPMGLLGSPHRSCSESRDRDRQPYTSLQLLHTTDTPICCGRREMPRNAFRMKSSGLPHCASNSFVG